MGKNIIEKRKNEHIKICLEKNVESKYNYWNDIQLIHNALPEIDEEDINIETNVFGKKLNAPIIIAGMTGGTKIGEKLNERFAQCAEKFGIGFGVGSQRAGLENEKLERTYSIIKKFDIPLVIGNIGAPQIGSYNLEKCKRAMEMIDADILAIHLNFLQEAVQLEGERKGKGCLDAIGRIAENMPVIVKETGSGISFDTAKLILTKKIIGIDVGGSGGTTFAGVEYYRSGKKNIGKLLWDWGIPTPISIMAIRKADKNISVIATGGIRTGIDIAKAIVVGANCAGIALPLLEPASKSKELLFDKIKNFINELRMTMFLMGAKNVESLKTKKYLLFGKLREWVVQDGY
ncbi:MAG: type 2 isopentenyl-diphosphate Delta-isomerase [Candidatus Thermoplasmatota archaeon]